MHIPSLPMAIRTDIVWAGHEALSGVVLRNQSCRPLSDFLLTHVGTCHVSQGCSVCRPCPEVVGLELDHLETSPKPHR
jgi:hypothetical protein